MSRPVASVVIPTRDRPELLRQTLKGVRGQQGIDFEVIVVDDGSTVDIDPALAEVRGAVRAELVRQPTPSGVAAARNAGVAASRGEWVAFLDDDDLWAPDKLTRQLETAERADTGWVFAGAVAFVNELRLVAGAPPPAADTVRHQILRRNVVPAGSSNVLVHRDFLSRVMSASLGRAGALTTGPFDTRLRHMADWDLWIRLADEGPPAVVAEPLVAYRMHPGNASLDTAEIRAELDELDRRYENQRPGKIDRPYVYRWIAWSSLRAGRRSEAVTAYLQAALAGDVLSLGRAVLGVLSPGKVSRPLRRHLPEPEWAAAAAAWLRAYRG